MGRTRGDYGATITAEIADAIDNAYRSLGTDVAVAVRSSGTTEDAGDSSFAGLKQPSPMSSDSATCWRGSLLGVAVRRASVGLSDGATSDRRAGMGRSEAVRPGQDFLEPLVPKDASKIKS